MATIGYVMLLLLLFLISNLIVIEEIDNAYCFRRFFDTSMSISYKYNIMKRFQLRPYNKTGILKVLPPFLKTRKLFERK